MEASPNAQDIRAAFEESVQREADRLNQFNVVTPIGQIAVSEAVENSRIRHTYVHTTLIQGHGAAERTFEDPDTGRLFLDM